MKKQIAVLMAAATAVTTVAPAIANADVNNHKDVSVNEAVEKARKALNDKYDNSKANGITLPTGSSLAKDYLNSKYIVLVGVSEDKEALQGFDRYDKSEYANLEFTAEVAEKTDGISEDVNIVHGTEKASKIEGGDKTWYVVDNATKLGTLLEANDDAVVSIIDKGSKDGSSVRTTDKKHYISTPESNVEDTDQTVSLTTTAKKLYDLSKESETDTKATFVESVKINGKTKIVDDKTQQNKLSEIKDVTKIELELTEGKTFTLEVNDDALDLKEALDKDGNTIKTDNVNTQDVLDKIVDFKLIANKDDKSIELDINNGDTEVYTVNSDAVEESLGLNNIYTREDGYTSEGKDFVNGLVNAKTNDKNTFNFRGTNYEVIGEEENANIKDYMNGQFDKAIIDKSGDGYKLTFNLKVRDANDKDVEKTLKFVVKGDKQRDLYDVLRDLKGSVEVVSGHFTKLAGSNRYATAVEVSAEQFKPETADSVVIVGGKAQLDGLAAAPLASAKNAPILLADPNTGLNRDTIKEIDRACKSLKNKTVYIVGGEQSVPAKVAKQLEDEFGAVVKRVAGANRRATSVEVAKRLNYDGNTNDRLFLVGGEGAADAMSVSAVASYKVDSVKNTVENDAENTSKKVSPILVVDAKGIDRDTRDFIKNDLQKEDDVSRPISETYLVGGEKSLSTQVLRDVNLALKDKKASRVSGDNRYDTNVEVIKAFYNDKTTSDQFKDSKITVNGAIFASGENAYLVDAQTAGSFAAAQRSPIVLSGNKLTNDQIDLMKDGGVLDNQRANIYQVGGVVSSDVMKVVVDKLDL